MFRSAGICILVLSFAVAWFWMAFKSAADGEVFINAPIIFEVSKGDSFNRVTRKLNAMGIVKDPFYFKILGRLENATNRLKAGEYKIIPGITLRDVLAMMVKGRVQQYSLSFIEGWTFQMILNVLSATPELKHELADKSVDAIMELMGSPDQHPEGRFFPDTYFFNRGTSDIAILEQAYGKMVRSLESEWQNREKNLPFKSSYEALILASIVEKETGQAGERPVIAGVFIRRLQKGMLLQTDPTVIYGMGKLYKGNLRIRDLHTDTPYNTYTRKGLPPTPIAIPGRAAIRAVLHPQQGSSLYFVARGDGTHVFSSTLREHNRAVDIFQRKRAIN